MTTNYQKQHAAQLSKIRAQLPASAGELLKLFVEQFYAKVPAPDLQRIEPKAAVALARSAYQFMENRASKVPKIRIFQPAQKDYGYEGRYTVVELLNDDMPFLVDSLSAELTQQGFTIRETIHPIFKAQRDGKGNLRSLSAEKEATLESFIHFEISALPEDMQPAQLQEDLERVLENIRASVADWPAIVSIAEKTIGQLDSAKLPFEKTDVKEVQDFLHWLIERNFIFLGYAEYRFFDTAGKEKLSVVPGSPLGILKIGDRLAKRGLEALPAPLKHLLFDRKLVEITKSNRRSPVHRAVPMDYVGIKHFNNDGKVIGEARFLGLFTSNVYYQSAEIIPLVRRKIQQALARSDFDPVSHDGKSLKAILEFLPRDEIFQMSEDDLFETSMGILALESKPGVRVFARKDAFERFISAMVFVPKERFTTELRFEIQHVLENAYGGSVSTYSTQIGEAPLARLHLIVKTEPGAIPEVDTGLIENEIAKRAYLWGDLLADSLLRRHDEQKAEKLQRLYDIAFPQSYINRYDSDAAVYDIDKIEAARAEGGLSLEIFRNKAEDDQYVHLKIYNPNEEIPLSDILPMLENAGFRAIEEHPFQIGSGENQVWIRDFKLQINDGAPLEEVKSLLEEALLKVWHRGMENDRFNALITKAGLNWRQVTMLRSYAKYLKQIGFTYSQAAIEQAFNQQPKIASTIAALFEARFSLTAKDRDTRQATLRAETEQLLSQVSNAAEDQILRRYLALINATLRTNYFQIEKGEHKPVLSLKFASALVPELPLPRPFAEIFVYGTRVEGIHMRGGKVARGGLRWSDRHEDFRTEVLGLMKAQMVKNSVIVPVGSKGGFVVKQPPAAREAMMQEGIECYKLYLHGLLDITDNIVKGRTTPPAQTVRYDEDDPYLVVAADKGTASFSDIANGVSAKYSFWLGDAFASGGSAGYDHKKMAITARGAFVSVARHFREMGVNTASTDFSVVGIGDMAGDVFGNGMLLSQHIKLVAAFNHMHIFIDPNPDTKTSFNERQRLFNLPRSSWKDYDSNLISKGGGVFERSAKSIAVSKEAQAALGLDKSNFTPDELMRAILLAPVDLLWNGGIGTYVKAEEETHEQVGDRANNALRVDGRELRCKVVGEGGNLGFTQKGRIEYARAGGRINTDAIDNSAGVDCSDHEVNIKIAFAHEMAVNGLTLAKRDKLLVAMTEDVARLVLKDNILQTQALTIAEQQGALLLESQGRLISTLERTGFLDRAIEYLPSDRQLVELKLAQKGLTRPELAVLLAYSKMELYRLLLETGLPDEPYFISDLMRYFPKLMQKDFTGAINNHPLRREIIATVMTNSLVNRAGITFFFDIAEDLGAAPRDVAAAYAIARDAFGLRSIWNGVEAVEAQVPIAAQVQIYQRTHQFLERIVSWLLRNLPQPLDIQAISKELIPGIAELEKAAGSLHSSATRNSTEKLMAQLAEQLVPFTLAKEVAQLELLSSACDIIAIASASKLDVIEAGKLYFALGARVPLAWLRESAERIDTLSHWERLAVQALVNDFYDEQRRLTLSVIENGGSLEAWEVSHKNELERLGRFMQELQSTDLPDIPKLMVALRHVKGL